MTTAQQRENFLTAVIGVEPFDTVFQRAVEKVQSESPTLRWEGRREWMAFMREHIVEYLAHFPDARNDLIDFLERTISLGKGRASYLADATAVLAATVAK